MIKTHIMRDHILIVIFTTFISLSGISQNSDVFKGDTINRIDEKNWKQGNWIIFDKSKTSIIEEGVFKNNRRSGVWKKYYDSGKAKHEITYIKGKPDGFARFYYENGNVSEEGLWKMNKWVGDYKFYFENGNLSYNWNYNKEGKREGEQKYFHENGNLMIAGDWTNGQESGVIKEYYENGSLKSEKNFSEGTLQQESIKYYKQDEVATKPQKAVSTNKNVGIFDGNGYYKTYTKTKKPDREGVFKGGKFMDGKRFIYNSQDILIRTDIYRNGNIIESINN